jgi:anti-sigma regulatory factor (Ser/Thr protein kinase)
MACGYSHEALLYAGEDGFMAETVPFVRAGVELGEPVLVAVSARKIARMRDQLGEHAEAVLFADMAEIGKNPAWIIPAWQEFLDEHAIGGRAVRGIGEPISPDRSAAELVEAQRHESLLNLAFADAPAFRLLCPYDVDALHPTVVEEARRSHPTVVESGTVTQSATYRGLDAIAAPFDEPLPAPPPGTSGLEFGLRSLHDVRELAARAAAEAGFGRARTEDLVLAVNEVATNSVRHGGGRGVASFWRVGGSLVCEVRDSGRVEDPMVGRVQPSLERPGGRGHWLANRLCDLVQVRTFPHGTIVRLHMAAY